MTTPKLARADSFRKENDTVAKTPTRTVLVNRARTPQEMLDATKQRAQYTVHRVVDSMPRGEEEALEVTFVNLGHSVSDDNLDKELEALGFKLTDPYTVGAVNEADPTFVNEHPNGTHWKDINDDWCFIAFYRWQGPHEVSVGPRVGAWNSLWWFPCVRLSVRVDQ